MKSAVTLTPKNMHQAFCEFYLAQKKDVDVAEIRADFSQLSEHSLEYLVNFSSFPLILTNRHPQEGGEYEGSEEERASLLIKGIESGVNYVDIESQYFDSVGEEAIQESESKIISSAHFFNGMPDLEEQYNKMAGNNADYIKIASKIDNVNDLFEMLNFSESHEDNIFVGMGNTKMKEEDYDRVMKFMEEKGYNEVAQRIPELKGTVETFSTMSRVLMEYFGGHLTYGALRGGGKAAPGQPTIEELNYSRNILEGCDFLR